MLAVCPHCDCLVEIEAMNCGIFRHAVFKHNGQPVPPHASLQDCEVWLRMDIVYGCGKPFQWNGQEMVKCGYI